MSPFCEKFTKYFFLFFKRYSISVYVKIISANNWIRFNPLFSMIFNCFYLFFFLLFHIFCLFFQSFSQRGIINLVCPMTLFWPEGSVSSPLWHYYLSTFPDDYADDSTASLLTSYCSFFISNLIINCHDWSLSYILFKRFFLKREGLSDARVVLINEYGFALHFL